MRNIIFKTIFSYLPKSFYVKSKIGKPRFIAQFDLRDRHQFTLYMHGDHEPDTEKLFRSLVKDAKCFIDIGAYIGTYSLQAAKINPAAKIYAAEPFPKLKNSLEEGIKANGFQNINLYELALSDNDGQAFLSSSDILGESGWNFVTCNPPKDASCIKVETLKLDTLLAKFKAPAPDIIKIDVEGHELNVLKGAVKTLDLPGQRQIIIEINEPCLKNQGTSGKEINDFLVDHGYKGFVILKEGKLKPVFEPGDLTQEMNYYYLKEK